MGGEHALASPAHVGGSLLDSGSGLTADFTLPDVLWVLQRLETRERPAASDPLILIGGQALNYWCDKFRIGNPDLERHGPFASKDLDFQAAKDLIPWCSQQLNGEFTLAEAGDKSLLNGVVTLHPEPGRKLRLDFMQRAYGLSAEKVAASAATVNVTSDGLIFGMRVMHPLHCLQSRVHNVMGLPDHYANEHGLRQLEASIVCLRLFIEGTAVAGDEKRARDLNDPGPAAAPRARACIRRPRPSAARPAPRRSASAAPPPTATRAAAARVARCACAAPRIAGPADATRDPSPAAPCTSPDRVFFGPPGMSPELP